LSGRKLKTSVPITMPRTIAIRMYCVKRLDISYPHQFRQCECGRFVYLCNTLPVRQDFSGTLPLWNASMRTSVHAAHNGCNRARTTRSTCTVNNHGPRGEIAMNDTINRQILLVEKPTGKLGPEHFKLTKGAIPEPKDGEALVRTRYISLDAANRAWM